MSKRRTRRQRGQALRRSASALNHRINALEAALATSQETVRKFRVISQKAVWEKDDAYTRALKHLMKDEDELKELVRGAHYSIGQLFGKRLAQDMTKYNRAFEDRQRVMDGVISIAVAKAQTEVTQSMDAPGSIWIRLEIPPISWMSHFYSPLSFFGEQPTVPDDQSKV